MPNCAPANGTIRTEDGRIIKLYQKAKEWEESPCLWEGLFRIACLIKNKPLEEPVAIRIYESIKETENGAFAGSFYEQICAARAAFAVFEYNTDKAILRRIAVWLRYLEVEFEKCTAEDNTLYRPADLMELLVRYYSVTGMKSVLRICSRLRAEAFDWTTALHTFQQSIPIRNSEKHISATLALPGPEELEYDEREKLINHAEMLADGMRYTLFSGLFSGHGGELASGRVLWEYLSRHHRAICGGTTADPFLSGTASDKPVGNLALAAWAEAFGAQMILPETEWATDEMIRIVFNGLEDCLERDVVPDFQMVNTVYDAQQNSENRKAVYSRITRAVATAYRNTVMITASGIKINYLLTARYIFMNGKQPVILHTNSNSATFRCKKPFISAVDIYLSKTCTSEISLVRHHEAVSRKQDNSAQKNGIYLRTEREWQNEDGYRLEQNDTVFAEETHHQGICFFADNRLLAAGADTDHYAYAITGVPKKKNGKITVPTAETSRWKMSENIPADIPVLPDVSETITATEITPYYMNRSRIAMFPKAGHTCLK